MNNISNFSTSLVLFLQRCVFVPFTPVAFIKWGLTLWPKLIPYAIVPSFLGNCVIYLYWLLDWKLTSLSHVTFAGYVRRDSCWFTVCYILFEQIETEVRLKVSFWPASWDFIYQNFDCSLLKKEFPCNCLLAYSYCVMNDDELFLCISLIVANELSVLFVWLEITILFEEAIYNSCFLTPFFLLISGTTIWMICLPWTLNYIVILFFWR